MTARRDDKEKSWPAKRRWLLAWLIGIGLFSFTYWFVPNVWKLRDDSVVVTRWERQKGETLATVGPGRNDWIATKAVSRHFLHAIVVAEDSRFYQHNGLDWTEITISAKLNWKKGRFVRGASTITQQVIKMALLSRDKTLLRKSREAVGALLLENMLNKEEILTWYINLAEFGDGIYGVNNAAWHYFKTKPELMTIQQSVHLALVLPSPNRWSYGLRRGDLTDFGHRRFLSIVQRMRRSGYITREQEQTVLASGNFGNPIKGFRESVQVAEDEPLDEETEPEALLFDPDLDEDIMTSVVPAEMPTPLEKEFSDEQ